MANNQLEARIHQIITGAAGSLHDILGRIATEVVQAVRHDIISHLQPMVSDGGATKGTAQATQPSAKASVAAKAQAAAKGNKGTTKAAEGRRGVHAANMERLLEVITQSPGLRSEEVAAKAGVASKEAKAALKKLRAAGSVQIHGEKRGATYRLVGAAASAPAAAAAPKVDGRSKTKAAKATKATKATPAARPVKRKGKRRQGSPGNIDTAKVLEAIRASKGGASSADIARVIGETDPRRLRYALQELRNGKKVTMSGQRSAARYHAV